MSDPRAANCRGYTTDAQGRVTFRARGAVVEPEPIDDGDGALWALTLTSLSKIECQLGQIAGLLARLAAHLGA